jgi:hypothetical protein
MTVMLIAIPSLIVTLALMAAMTRVNRSAPQAYYLKKQRDVSILFGQADGDADRRGDGDFRML